MRNLVLVFVFAVLNVVVAVDSSFALQATAEDIHIVTLQVVLDDGNGKWTNKIPEALASGSQDEQNLCSAMQQVISITPEDLKQQAADGEIQSVSNLSGDLIKHGSESAVYNAENLITITPTLQLAKADIINSAFLAAASETLTTVSSKYNSPASTTSSSLITTYSEFASWVKTVANGTVLAAINESGNTYSYSNVTVGAYNFGTDELPLTIINASDAKFINNSNNEKVEFVYTDGGILAPGDRITSVNTSDNIVTVLKNT